MQELGHFRCRDRPEGCFFSVKQPTIASAVAELLWQIFFPSSNDHSMSENRPLFFRPLLRAKAALRAAGAQLKQPSQSSSARRTIIPGRAAAFLDVQQGADGRAEGRQLGRPPLRLDFRRLQLLGRRDGKESQPAAAAARQELGRPRARAGALCTSRCTDCRAIYRVYLQYLSSCHVASLAGAGAHDGQVRIGPFVVQ